MTLRPIYRSFKAEHWPTTKGEVLTSQLAAKQGNKGGVSYRIDIHYRYVVNQQLFESNQYDSSGTSTYSGWHDAKQAVVNAHRPGAAVDVHYNPADPADAMLSTALPHGLLVIGWLPLIFVAGGLVFMIASGKAIGKKPGMQQAKALETTPAEFDSRRGRRQKFFVLLVLALFWNGIVIGIFFAGAGWCVIPFAVVGVGIVIGAVMTLLAMFNPTVAFSFNAMPLQAGMKADGTYKIDGNYLAVRELKIFLEGREQVSYRQGTNTRNETHVAYHLPILETLQAVEIESGKISVQIPFDAMTSFKATNNQFTWHLCVRGDIPGRPNIKDEFDVVVLPPKGSR
ncbi:MAG: DUF3592 domain-containing protein [Tepidisphaeraceae bacterium]